MLNISKDNSVKIDLSSYESPHKIMAGGRIVTIGRFLLVLLLFIIGFMFLPWRQNVSSEGYLTSLLPSQRPQTIHSTIAGRIEVWKVSEGQEVRKGDTILLLSEVKTEYFDSLLLKRQGAVITAKGGSLEAYRIKVQALENQENSLKSILGLKLEQLKNKILQTNNKIVADSMDWAAAKNDELIALRQLERTETLQKEGLKSVADVENARVKAQNTSAKKVSSENKYLNTKNELINAKIELSSTQAEYQEKMFKIQSDKSSVSSAAFEAEGERTKMQNQYSNYEKRASFYVITAPQDGYITQALKTGLGETIKEGEAVVTIMPKDFSFAAELYISPMNIAWVQLGGHVQLMFDGIPSLAISGWTRMNTGTFPGEIVAIDNFISENGMYRILVAPEKNAAKDWPQRLRIGTGAKAVILLQTVSVGYEIWRQVNGFPPDYYENMPEYIKTKKDKKEKDKEDKVKFKAPIKYLK